jgi:hypothetical protein
MPARILPYEIGPNPNWANKRSALPMDRNQKESPSDDQQRFSEHLKKATEIVRSWPLWKQSLLGEIDLGPPCCDQEHITAAEQAANEPKPKSQ